MFNDTPARKTDQLLGVSISIDDVCFAGGWKFLNFKKCHPGTISLDKIVSYCQPKHVHPGQRVRPRVRQANQPPTSVMAFNPNYDYVSAKHLDHSLVQVPRKHIKLTRWDNGSTTSSSPGEITVLRHQAHQVR